MSLQTYCRVTTDILLTHTGMGEQYVCSDSTRQDSLWLHTVMCTSHTGMGQPYVCSDSTRSDCMHTLQTLKTYMYPYSHYRHTCNYRHTVESLQTYCLPIQAWVSSMSVESQLG